MAFPEPPYSPAVYRRWALVATGLGCLVATYLAASPLERRLLGNTARLAFAVECLALPVAAVMAFLVTRTNIAGRRAVLILCCSLLFVPLYLQLAGWDAAFGRLGWYTVAVTGLREPWLAGWRGAVVIHALYAIPWATCLMAALFAPGDRALEEAALLDGPPLQVLFRVTLPGLAGGLLMGALWIFVVTAGEMTVTNIYLVPTYAEEVYNLFATSADVQAAAIQLRPLLLFTTALVMVSVAAADYFLTFHTESRARVWSLGKARGVISAAVVVFVLALVVVPLANLVERMGERVSLVNQQPVRSWQASQVAAMLRNVPGQFLPEFATTLQIAALVAAIAVPLAAAAAWVGRKRVALSYTLWLLAAVGIAVPAPMIGLAVIALLNHDAPLMIWLYDRTLAPPVLAILVRVVPLCFAGLWWSFRTLDEDPFEAAALDGAGSGRQFLSLALPQRWPMLAAATLVAFVVASGDLSASILTLPAGVETVARRMFGLIHSGVDDQVAAMGLVGWLGYLAFAAATVALVRGVRGRRRNETLPFRREDSSGTSHQ
jgi:iron(III) transport system permease protein